MPDLLFMKLAGDNFKGEEPVSSGTSGPGLVRINSFSHNISQDLARIRPSAHLHSDSEKSMLRKGEPQQGSFTVNRYFDKVSIQLFAAASAGIVFDWVAIYFCSVVKDDDDHTTKPVWEIFLKRCVIEDFVYEYSGNWPQEVLSFAFTSIEWRTNWPKAYDGSETSALSFGWSGTEIIVYEPTDYDSAAWKWQDL